MVALKRKEYLTIFIILVTEVLGFSLIIPLLPFYIEELGGTPLTAGLIFTIFALLQFISSPIMGKLSDKYGRKPLLILSQLSTFASFIVLGFANSIFVILLSRAIDGLIGSNQVIAQSYVSDISSKENRSQAYGITGAAFGVGFLIGPAVGGFLAEISFALPAFLAAGLSLLTVFMTIFLLDETVKDGAKSIDLKSLRKDINPIHIAKNLQNKNIRIPLLIFFAYVFAQTAFVSNFALFSEYQFGVTLSTIGILLAYIGFVTIVLRSVLLSILIGWFGEHKLKILGFITMFFSFIGFAIFSNTIWLYIAGTFFALGSGVLRPQILADISRNASDKNQGEIIGIAGSFGSMARIISPVVGGYLLTYITTPSLPLAAGMFIAVGLLLYIMPNSQKLANVIA